MNKSIQLKYRQNLQFLEMCAVAEAIAEFQGCSDCSDAGNESRHCSACEGEAMIAIAAIDAFRGAQ